MDPEQVSGGIDSFPTQFTPPDPNSVAANIPLDIFIDDISPYLHVEDILALRRVNKHYFHLTHEPVIWKRFLRELRIPLPPIRPTLNYSSTDDEIEQLVTRAISMQDNWRRGRPTVASTRVFDAPYEILDMKLLPGGKYLVALIKDNHRFIIVLYHLDHPSRLCVLAGCKIPTKAYHLQAKYMTYKGKPVIMVAYVRRVSDEHGQANINLERFANDPTIDLSAFDIHVLHCMHVDLSTVDQLAACAPRDPADSKTTKRFEPFMKTAKLLLTRPPAQLSLYSREGVAHASVAQDAIVANGQDYLIIVNLEQPRKPCVLVCQPYVYPHDPYRSVRLLPNMKQWIKAVRHLPEQDDVLIWRTIRTTEPDADDEKHAHSIEVLKMPPRTHKTHIFLTTPFWGHVVLPDGKVQSVHMTDDLWPYDGQSDFPLQASFQPPPPISVFAEMSRPRGILHWHIWPTDRHDPGRPPYVYYPSLNTVIKQTMHDAEPYTGHVLPGVFHSLIYTTEETNRTGASLSLIALRRYISPEYQANSYRVARVERHSIVERHDYQPMPIYVYATIDIGQEALARYRLHGLGVVVWDHTIGRLCLTTGRGSVLEVIDFSHATPPDNRFHNPKMTSPVGSEQIHS